MNTLQQQISNSILALLIKLRDFGLELRYHQDDYGIHFHWVGHGTKITLQEAADLIDKHVVQTHSQHQRVYLYHCPDNALITIDNISRMEDSDKELYQAHEVEDLYVGWD